MAAADSDMGRKLTVTPPANSDGENPDKPGAQNVLKDTTNDGKVDRIKIDTSKDGKHDTILKDTTGDGKFDVIQDDTTGDGKINRTAKDTTGDGNIDHIEEDTAGRGRINRLERDLTGDGIHIYFFIFFKINSRNFWVIFCLRWIKIELTNMM